LLAKKEQDFYSKALSQIADIKPLNPELYEIFEFYESTLKAQREVYLLFSPDLSDMDHELCRTRNSEGLPCLKAEDFKPDANLVKKLAHKTTKIIRKKSGDAVPSCLDGGSLAGQQKEIIKGLVEDISLLERIAGELQIDFPVFYFLIKTVYSPFLTIYAEKMLKTVEINKWQEGFCPVCGGEPLIARLEEKAGKRWFFCSMCHTGWAHKRMACPFCENDDPKALRYFYVENDEARRVDVCDKCKRYIKTIDYRKIDRVLNPFVENISTLALDIVAEKEGFRGADISFSGER
jgi:FdhE protein